MINLAWRLHRPFRCRGEHPSRTLSDPVGVWGLFAAMMRDAAMRAARPKTAGSAGKKKSAAKPRKPARAPKPTRKRPVVAPRKTSKKSKKPAAAKKVASKRKATGKPAKRSSKGKPAARRIKAKPRPSSKAVSPSRRSRKAPKVIEKKRRKPRMYSDRSKLASFVLGDVVVFRRVRDWNDRSRFFQLTGRVIAKGHDPDIGVNYIEVAFEVETPPGEIKIERRRFFVK